MTYSVSTGIYPKKYQSWLFWWREIYKVITRCQEMINANENLKQLKKTKKRTLIWERLI